MIPPYQLCAQLERELTAAKEELTAAKELLSATQTECLARANDLNHGADREIVLEDTIALLRKRVEAADGLAAQAEHARSLLAEETFYADAELLAIAIAAYRATEGKT